MIEEVLMAALVLVEFESDEAAAAFVGKILPKKSIKPLGVWDAPRKFCECPPKSRLKPGAFVRSARTGVMLHRECRRPSKFWNHRTERLAMMLGKNLLPELGD